jgi:hypothetical protein
MIEAQKLQEITERYNESPFDWQGIKRDDVNIVLCPANMPRKWLSEIKSTLNGAFARIVETAEDVHDFIDEFDEKLAKGENPRAIMIFTYERAKLGEKIIPAYQIYWGKDGFEKYYDQTSQSWKWRHKQWCIDPVTGGVLKGLWGRKIDYIDEKRINRSKRWYFYEGNVFQHYETYEEQRTNRYGRVIDDADTYVRTVPVNFRAVSDKVTYDGDKHYPLPMFQQSRAFGLPKKGNGIVDIGWDEIVIPEKKGRIPTYRENPDTGKLEFVAWKEYTRREFTINRAKIKKILTRWRLKDLDQLTTAQQKHAKWLAMQGVYCMSYGSKRKKINDLMRKHKISSYRIGRGIPALDKELKKINARDYIIDQGAATYRNPRYPLVDYIKQKYRNRIGLLIIDEIHRAKAGDSDQAVATRRLSMVARFTLGLTGTFYGGKASSIYPLAHHFSPWVKYNYEWVRSTPMHWINDFGGIETVYVDKSHNSSGVYTGNQRFVRTQGKEIPSASPELLRVMFPFVIFGGLSDLGSAMPRFVEKPIEVKMGEIQRGIYDEVHAVLEHYLASCIKSGDHSFTGSYYSNMLRLPDSMFRENEVIHRIKKDKNSRKAEVEPKTILVTPSIGDLMTPKEEMMCDLIRKHLDNGENVIVFMSQTNTRDIQPHIENIITENCPKAKPFILKSSVRPMDRMKAIDKKMEDEHNVMICNPMLVSEGVDLIDFSVTIYIEVHPSLQVMSQSSRRTWRLNQPKDRVIVYYLYYDDVYQNKAVKSVADKNRAANTLYGNDEQGIAELAQTNEFFAKMGKMAKDAGRLSQEEMEAAFSTADYTDIDYINSSWYSDGLRKEYKFLRGFLEKRTIVEDIDIDDMTDDLVEEIMGEWME